MSSSAFRSWPIVLGLALFAKRPRVADHTPLIPANTGIQGNESAGMSGVCCPALARRPGMTGRTRSAHVRPGPSGGLKHRRTPFALDRQNRGHWSKTGFLGGRRDRLDVLGLRSPAHEKIIDHPLGAMPLAAQWKSPGDRRGRIEVLVGAADTDAKLIGRHLGRLIDHMPLVVHRPVKGN